jgi:hypothetical protein
MIHQFDKHAGQTDVNGCAAGNRHELAPGHFLWFIHALSLS